jgi:hypothetical protein
MELALGMIASMTLAFVNSMAVRRWTEFLTTLKIANVFPTLKTVL